MRKYYTRPCNFYYGNYAKQLIKKKKALSLAGNPKARADCELSKGAVGEARGTSAPTEMITQKGWRRFCLF